jgi:aspartokinase-like uncharacterized kinase
MAGTDGSLLQTVVKLGGGLLAHDEYFGATLTMIGEAAAGRRLLIVPGGGPFADAVREIDRRIGLSPDSAHWMAVLAMDQYAHLIAPRMANGVLVTDRAEIVAALDVCRVPVLAPTRWMRRVDPLPHTWDVTSDSIAAWTARAVDARHLVLIKPPGARSSNDRSRTDNGRLVDAYFDRVLPADVTAQIIPADHTDELYAALRA